MTTEELKRPIFATLQEAIDYLAMTLLTPDGARGRLSLLYPVVGRPSQPKKRKSKAPKPPRMRQASEPVPGEIGPASR
jgi:hypothetical protein